MKRPNQFIALFLLGVVSSLCLSSAVGAHNSHGPKIHQVLDKKTEDLKREIVPRPKIIEAIQAANSANKELSEEEILSLDKKWRATEGVDQMIAGFIANPVGEILMEFQENNPGFSEIFITDKKGLIVAATNKTSDYYQADEEWWIKAFNESKGFEYYGEMEYDDSAMSESISIYLPIKDEDENVIGILKAVIEIFQLRRELR